MRLAVLGDDRKDDNTKSERHTVAVKYKTKQTRKQ
jgi:hypothetical protein